MHIFQSTKDKVALKKASLPTILHTALAMLWSITTCCIAEVACWTTLSYLYDTQSAPSRTYLHLKDLTNKKTLHPVRFKSRNMVSLWSSTRNYTNLRTWLSPLVLHCVVDEQESLTTEKKEESLPLFLLCFHV